MEKQVIYEYQKDGCSKFGIIDNRIYQRYIYDNFITPIRFKVIECTRKGLHALYNIYNIDRIKFREIIEEELSDALTYYSN